MRRTAVVGSIVVALLMFAALLAGGAAAAGTLVLKTGGQVAPVGEPLLGTLQFGPCGTFESRGELTVNSSSVDVARFGETSGGGGGCGEGGPIVSGSISADRLAAAGRFTVLAQLTYTTTLEGFCSYAVKSLQGKLAIPGPTQALVSGTGRLEPGESPSCAERKRVTGVEARLYDVSTNELLEAEP